MLNIVSQKLPIICAREVIKIDLKQAHTHQEKPEIANYFYERVEVALHKLAEHEGIKWPSFYDRKHHFRSARTPETPDQKALQQSIADVHFERGEVLSRLNQWDKAKAQYKKAYQWDHPSAQERLKVLAQLPARPSSSSIPAVSTPSAVRLSTPVPNVEQTPAFKFFLKNLPLIPPALPQAGRPLRNAEQLVYCLLLLNLDQQEPTSTAKLSAEESVWLARVKQDQDDQELRRLAEGVIPAFEEDKRKNAAAASEVAALAPVYALDDFQNLLNKLITKLCNLKLLDFDLLHGLVQMIRYAPPASLRTDDLVKILENLAPRLKNTHAQSAENRYRLAMAVNQVLDAMADNHVTDLNREALHQPLRDFFREMKQSTDPYLVYQAEYACQALAYVPDDETPWQGAWRRISVVVQGAAKFVSAAKAFDLNGFIEGVQDLQQPIGELIQFATDTYEQVKALKESGQELIESLKEGFSFDRKHVWYPMLRGMDEVPSDQLDTFKQKLMQKELQACRWHKTFLWGLSERLARIAAHPEQASDTRQQALQWLGELYEDEQMWGKHPIIKKRVVQLIRTLANNSPVKEDANVWLRHLETVGDASQQTFYQDCLTSPLTPYPLYEARPQPMGLSLLDIVQRKQWVETDLHRFKIERIAHWGDPLYVPLRGKASLFDADTNTFDLAEKAEAFFKDLQNKKMALVLGDSGAGKSTFLRFLEAKLWKDYQKGGIIPLFIALPTIDDPEQDFIAKHLRRLGLNPEQIKTLKENREFVVIADGYDESGSNANLYQSNGFNQPGGGWRGQLIEGCRSQHLGDNYRQRFQPDDPTLFQEWVVAPFDQTQIDQYVQAHVEKHKTVVDNRFDLQHWQVQDYQRRLTQIDENFKRTPLLLKIALEVLPRLLSLEQSPVSSLTRVALYDEVMKARFEREKQRLQEGELTEALEDVFNALDEHGFVIHCMQFVTELAVAIYEKNQGNPVVEYDPVKDKGTWKDVFFGEAPRQRILRKAWPLIRNGNQYRFEHKSFLEYFATLDIYQPQEAGSMAEASVESVPPSGITGRRGSDASLLSFESQPERSEANAIEAIPLPDSLLMRNNLIKEPAIIQFLAERVQKAPNFKQQLRALVDCSKKEATVRKAAANAMTILIKAGVPFLGTNLSGIKIPGADLSYGVLDAVQLQGADLRKVNLTGAWLRDADLSGARMAGVQFGELPGLQLEDEVNACCYSSKGSLLVVAHGDIVTLYDAHTLEEKGRLTGHEKEVTSVAVSADGRYVVSGSYDKMVRAWDWQAPEATPCILREHGEPVTSVALSADGRYVVSGSQDKTVLVWDWHTPAAEPCVLSGHRRSVESVALSADGRYVVSGSYDYTVRVWDWQTPAAEPRVLGGHGGPVTSVALSTGGRYVVSGSLDGTVRVWDWQAPAAEPCVLSGHGWNVTSVAVSADDRYVVSGSQDKTVRVWDWQTPAAEPRVLRGHENWVKSVALSSDDRYVVSGSQDKTVRVWDWQTPVAVPRVLRGHESLVKSVALSDYGRYVVSGSYDQTVRVWDWQTPTAEPRVLRGHRSAVESVALSADGRYVVSGSYDQTVRVWDWQTPDAEPRVLSGHGSAVESVALSADDQYLVLGSDDHKVRVWDWHTPPAAMLCVLKGHKWMVTSVALSADGRYVVSGSQDKTVQVWDWQTSDAEPRALRWHENWVTSVALSADDRYVVFGSRDKTVRVWDWRTPAAELRVLSGHKNWVTSVVVSADGQVVSGSLDNTVRVWDMASGQCLATIQGCNGGVHTVAWKRIDGLDYLFTGSGDKAVRCWQLIPGDPQWQARLRWTSTQEVLTLFGANMEGVEGLSLMNHHLLKQRGAKGEPHQTEKKGGRPLLTEREEALALTLPGQTDIRSTLAYLDLA